MLSLIRGVSMYETIVEILVSTYYILNTYICSKSGKVVSVLLDF